MQIPQILDNVLKMQKKKKNPKKLHLSATFGDFYMWDFYIDI